MLWGVNSKLSNQHQYGMEEPNQCRRCEKFVPALPYVKEANDAGDLALYQDCSEIIFLEIHESLMKALWNDLFALLRKIRKGERSLERNAYHNLLAK